MALNLSAPYTGMDAFKEGFGTTDNLMQQMLGRKQLAQQAQQHKDKLRLQQQQQNRLQQKFNQEMRDRDMLQQMWGGGSPPGAYQQGQSARDMPTQEIGEGLGAYSPEGMQQAQQQAQAQKPPAIDMDAIKNSPYVRALYKHYYGFDPAAQVPQTPEQKQASAMELFKQKEEYKAQQEPKMPAAVKTLHENIIQLSPKASASIQGIIEMPSPFEPWGMGAFYSGQKAAHKKGVTAAAENYAKAKGWPNTKASIEKAESILERGHLETDHDYRKRLRGYQDELARGVEESRKFLHPNQHPPQQESGTVIEYVRRNGKLVPK